MDIDEADAARLRSIAPWVRRANREIERRVADARAHAERSLDPQPHPGAARQKLKAADSRLQELQRCLIGSGLGPAGLVQDARAEFYRQAHRDWEPMIPEQVRNPKGGPTMTGEMKARAFFIHDRSLLAEMEPTFQQAERSLKSSLNASTTTSRDTERAYVTLDTWEKKTSDSIKQRVLTCLSDAEVAIRDLVGRSLIRPDLRSWTE